MTSKTDTHLARAIDMHRRQDLAGAAALYDRIIRRDPQNFFAHHALGAIRAGAGQAAEALPLLRRATRLDPDHAEAQANLGAVLIQLQRLDEAEAPIRRAIALDPDATEPLEHLGKLLARRGCWEEALAAYRLVLERNPADASASFNMGNVLFRAGRAAAALPFLRRAVQLEPGTATFRTGLGLALAESGDLAGGLAQIRRAIELDPLDPAARQAEYGLLLAAGDWRTGLKQYESRSLGSARFFYYDHPGVPQWQGEDLAGRRILLHAEQGLGDTLMAVRYLALVRALRPALIILAVQPALKEFLAAGSEADAVIGFGEPLPAIDLHCPLLSLPRVFGTIVETVPAAPGYLRRHLTARPAIAEWLATIKSAGRDSCPPAGATAAPLEPFHHRQIGLVWSGNLQAASGRERSMPLEAMAPLLALDGVRFVALQTEMSAADAAYLAASTRLELLARGFADTAAAIDGLDLVVSVDTSLAHLAGGLARPCWILLPERADWRWLQDRADTPWYPTARLFRQSAGGGWPPVIEAVRRALLAVLDEP